MCIHASTARVCACAWVWVSGEGGGGWAPMSSTDMCVCLNRFLYMHAYVHPGTCSKLICAGMSGSFKTMAVSDRITGDFSCECSSYHTDALQSLLCLGVKIINFSLSLSLSLYLSAPVSLPHEAAHDRPCGCTGLVAAIRTRARVEGSVRKYADNAANGKCHN